MREKCRYKYRRTRKILDMVKMPGYLKTYYKLHYIPLNHRTCSLAIQILPLSRASPDHTGVEPARHGKNVVHGQVHNLLHRLAKWGHLCALKHNGSDIRVVCHKALSRVDHFSLNSVEAVRALHANQPLQVTSCRRTTNIAASSILLRDSEALKVKGSEFGRVVGDDTDLLVWCKPGEDGGDLKERGGRNGDGEPFGKPISRFINLKKLAADNSMLTMAGSGQGSRS
jgi:hypothetical protein